MLAAIVKFDPEHTAKVLQREEHKVSLVSLHSTASTNIRVCKGLGYQDLLYDPNNLSE